MLIMMKTRSAGPKGNMAPGDKIELDAENAKTLIRGGYAVQAPEEQKPVLAAAKAPEVERTEQKPEENASAPEGRHSAHRRR